MGSGFPQMFGFLTQLVVLQDHVQGAEGLGQREGEREDGDSHSFMFSWCFGADVG